ncbi:MAG TPA: CPBP family intramembrane glutamic endopeptidase [Rhodanobacteraceae bacterium]|nr:CPBP family intramembrane glutamic endopeptidase [Rhodanobacteraceae bacterium]
MRIRDILCTIIAAIVIRGFLEVAVGAMFNVDQYYVSRACQVVMYLMMVGALWSVARANGMEIGKVFGPRWPSCWPQMMVMWPIIILMFELGENAIEIIAVSKANLHFAYNFFNLHTEAGNPAPLLSWRVISFIVASTMVGPAAEEFVFRGLLLGRLADRYGVVVGVVVTSFIFTLLHFARPEYLAVFIFSVVMCVLYLRYQSLTMCMMVHAVHNLMAFLLQYYHDIQWTRSVSNVSSLSNWTVQIVMFIIATPILYWLVIHERKHWMETAPGFGNSAPVDGSMRSR